jgi:signal transduction histidine kinase
MRLNWYAWMHYAGLMLTPILIIALLYSFLREPLDFWRRGETLYDEYALKEWVREARVGTKSLPDMLKEFLAFSELKTKELSKMPSSPDAHQTNPDAILFEQKEKHKDIEEMLEALCLPPSKYYVGQLPLFPVIYRIEVHFDDDLRAKYDPRLDFSPVVWDAEIPSHKNQFRELKDYRLLREGGVKIYVKYQLHAYMQKQGKERRDEARSRLFNMWALFFTVGVVLWMLFIQHREAQREHQRRQSEQQIQETRQKHLEEELRRQEAERKQEDAERRRLEEELRRQQAERDKQVVERKALELKSHMFHSIGIMAKSYAHNIKNLLVRPNDLLRRCMEEQAAPEDKGRMLHEIKQTLATVTERLQEILQTVQRDPNQFERVQIDLNSLAKDLHKTWYEQSLDKWKMVVELDLQQQTPIYVSGDRSHLQQTLENFLFNARDAIAEMRNHLRQQARPDSSGPKAPLDETRRQALIAAAGWKGRIVIRTRLDNGQPVLEVEDNGIGMSDETLHHCTETNYTTKRDNALYAGLSAGMGLGLSFVQMILQQHGARLEIVSEPLKGALFRVRFPSLPKPLPG